jgi:NTE family protein
MWRWLAHNLRDWSSRRPAPDAPPVRIGLALGGGFARSLAHVGVLQVLEEQGVPIHAIAGISSGAIIAASWASGASLDEIISQGSCTTFSSYARWTLSRLGLATNERMDPWLRQVLRVTRFEDMNRPLAVVATDLATGDPVTFRDSGDIIAPIRASCAYPGLFLPVQIGGQWLVDGGISVSVPVAAAIGLGATHVIAVHLPSIGPGGIRPTNLLQVVGRSLAIAQEHMVADWRLKARLVVEPEVHAFEWEDFGRAGDLVQAGREAMLAALPVIRGWLRTAAEQRLAVQRHEEVVERLRQRRMRKHAVT